MTTTDPANPSGGTPPSTNPAVEVRPVELAQMALAESKDPVENIDKILDIPVLATVHLGQTHLQISDLLKLGTGSVVELDKRAGEPVELYINEKLIAYGEVVVVNETFGLRVTSIVDPKQRIQSLH